MDASKIRVTAGEVCQLLKWLNSPRDKRILASPTTWMMYDEIMKRLCLERLSDEKRINELKLAEQAEHEKNEAMKAARRTEVAMKALSAVSGFSADEIIHSKRRKHELVLAKHVAAFLLVEDFGFSTVNAGRVLKRDHSTIVHAVRRVRKMLRDGHETVTAYVKYVRAAVASECAT